MTRYRKRKVFPVWRGKTDTWLQDLCWVFRPGWHQAPPGGVGGAEVTALKNSPSHISSTTWCWNRRMEWRVSCLEACKQLHMVTAASRWQCSPSYFKHSPISVCRRVDGWSSWITCIPNQWSPDLIIAANCERSSKYLNVGASVFHAAKSSSVWWSDEGFLRIFSLPLGFKHNNILFPITEDLTPNDIKNVHHISSSPN